MKNKITQGFAPVKAIRMDASSQEQLKKAVETVAEIVNVAMAKLKVEQGVWIDTEFGNGSALQQVIDTLQTRFDYYGFEPSKKYLSDAAKLSERNLGHVNLSLELRGVAAHGKRNFVSWLEKTHEDYAARDGKPPLVVLNMNMGPAAETALMKILDYNHLPKIGMLVASFQPGSLGRGIAKTYSRVGNALNVQNTPIVEWHF